MRRLLRDYSFAWVTGVLFLASLLAQLAFQVTELAQEAAQHGSAFEWHEFWPAFGKSVMENWQSEFLQLIWQVVGLKYLLYRGSSQSRESDEQMQASLEELHRKVDDSRARVDVMLAHLGPG
jgi:hypothetical protein